MSQANDASRLNNPLANFEAFGPAPVLSSENLADYQELLKQLVSSLKPRDFLEKILVKQIVDSTWELSRYSRHKILAVERRYRENEKNIEGETQVKPSATPQRPNAAPQPTGSSLSPIDNVVKDIDEILSPALELKHAKALEQTVGYVRALDDLHKTATNARLVALEQLSRYRRVPFSREHEFYDPSFPHEIGVTPEVADMMDRMDERQAHESNQKVPR